MLSNLTACLYNNNTPWAIRVTEVKSEVLTTIDRVDIKVNKVKTDIIDVRVLLAPYSATSRELLGAAKASLRLGLGHPLYAPRACSLLPPPSVRLCPRVLPYLLITISSSSIDSLVTHARLACSLPYTWAILPHNIL